MWQALPGKGWSILNSRHLLCSLLVWIGFEVPAHAFDQWLDQPTRHVLAFGNGDGFGGAGFAYRYRFDSRLEAGLALGASRYGNAVYLVRYTPLVGVPLYLQIMGGGLENGTGRVVGNALILGTHSTHRKLHLDLGFGLAQPIVSQEDPSHHQNWKYDPSPYGHGPHYAVAAGVGWNFGGPTIGTKTTHHYRKHLSGCLGAEPSFRLSCKTHKSAVYAYRLCGGQGGNEDLTIAACRFLQKHHRKIHVLGRRLVEARERKVEETIEGYKTFSIHVPWSKQFKSRACDVVDIDQTPGRHIETCWQWVERHRKWWERLKADANRVAKLSNKIRSLAAGSIKAGAPFKAWNENMVSMGCHRDLALPVATGRVERGVLNRCLDKQEEFREWAELLNGRISTLQLRLLDSIDHTRYWDDLQAIGCVGLTAHDVGHGRVSESLLSECETLVNAHAQWWQTLKNEVSELAEITTKARSDSGWSQKFAKGQCSEMTASHIATGRFSEKTFDACKKLGSKFMVFYEAKMKKQRQEEWEQRERRRAESRRQESACCKRVYRQAGQGEIGWHWAQQKCGACSELEDCLRECSDGPRVALDSCSRRCAY
jgi:hypothetical protein